MATHICQTCGTQYPDNPEPPASCPICQDERQYVAWEGQRWTTPAELASQHAPRIEPEGELVGVGLEPAFAIGQRALLVPTPAGNVMWDCVPYLGEDMALEVEQRGGLAAIAVSHPHYYTSMDDWAERFGVPVYIHVADREWVQRPHPHLKFWVGEDLTIVGGLRLIRLGGHFAGGQVLHWPGGAGGAGALLTGDIIQVVQDRRWVSFMYSYPNLVPLPGAFVRFMVDRLEPYAFEQIYGAWWGRVVPRDAKAALRRSAERYERALETPLSDPKVRQERTPESIE